MVGVQGAILAVDMETARRKVWCEVPDGVDGISSGGEDGLVFSDFTDRVYWARQGAAPLKLLDTAKQGIHAADIHFMSDLGLLLVPTFRGDRIMAYSWNVPSAAESR